MGNPKGYKKGKQTKDSVVVKGGRNKPPRWRKGYSCVSNPSVNKYRVAAKQKSNVFCKCTVIVIKIIKLTAIIVFRLFYFSFLT